MHTHVHTHTYTQRGRGVSMEIEEPLVNELLLVGAALGSTETFTVEDGR